MTVGDGWPNTTYREEPEDKRADCNKKNTSCSQRKKKGTDPQGENTRQI
jgi:hypothetical protein